MRTKAEPKIDIARTIGLNLRVLCALYNYDKADLCAVMDVSYTTLRKIMKNPKKISVEQLIALSELTGFGVFDLMTHVLADTAALAELD
ncbi:MAG: hypothetical protein DBY36_01930 [Clostridiales bacterium]|nr:MAG: hypothetical protein DBY36_01930 [Clostridiales bacterium]